MTGAVGKRRGDDMDRVALRERILGICDRVAKRLGFEVVDLEVTAMGRRPLLRVFLDRQGGVTVDDCAAVSRELSVVLDVEDPLQVAYTLEVSSPGLDRPLRLPAHFAAAVGKEARVRVWVPVNGRSRFRGRVLGASGNEVRLLVDNKEVAIPLDSVQKANLIYDFEEDR